MILNHKAAIEFLIGAVSDIGFNPYTIKNLHALLANNLLSDPLACGKLRTIPVGVAQSVYHPLEIPPLIAKCFQQLLTTTAAIHDPFEQAFFIMVQLPYLQPFENVNKRVSRLAANIPLIKHNLRPLSFIDVLEQDYIDATLGVYELNRIELLRDIFVWAYERSTTRYLAVRHSLGEPDPFRLQYRHEIRELINLIINEKLTKKTVGKFIHSWIKQHLPDEQQQQIIQVIKIELEGLHIGNIARYSISPTKFTSWHRRW